MTTPSEHTKQRLALGIGTYVGALVFMAVVIAIIVL